MSAKGPELVIGLVGAAGADLRLVADALQGALADVGYESREIRLSSLLHRLKAYESLADLDKTDYFLHVDRHMTAGDELCATTGDDIFALLAIPEIRLLREEISGVQGGEGYMRPASRTAFLLNSLKRPEEVLLLRNIYGNSFILVSAYASREKRAAALAVKIAKSRTSNPSECRGLAETLINRDESEAEVSGGQNVRDTFPLGDVFVDADNKATVESSVQRAVSIIFGHPFLTPTPAELGMQYARTTALRSADLSRQVGYAAMRNGQLIAVGANEVAKRGGGHYWPGDANDQRDFMFSDREPNAELKHEILTEMLNKFRERGIIAKETTLDAEQIAMTAKVLENTRFMSITEYGRAVHAEMSLITDAARRGVSLQDATMYGTTFPCHNCAKNIVAAGVKRVVYVEPYPKSQVVRLFSDSISVESDCEDKVVFEPFVGIAPQRFSDFFTMTDRKLDGKVVKWEALKRTAWPRVSNDPLFYLGNETSQVLKLEILMSERKLQW